MTKIIEAVMITYQPAWRKWPDTEDRDYSSVLSQRTDVPYTLNGEDVIVRIRPYSPYRAYALAGVSTLPVPHPYTNNLMLPPQNVLDAMARDLTDIAADGCKICYWDAARQCYAPVAQLLKRLFLHSILIHVDDCPGATECKSQPIAHFFDTVFHGNLIWTSAGELTSDLYKRFGVTDVHYISMSPTGGFKEGLNANGPFDIDARLQQLRAGRYSTDLIFIGGCFGVHRPQLNSMEYTAAFQAAGLRTRVLGHGMRDGELQPNDPLSALLGSPVARAYLDSFAVLNSPFIGLMGTRPFDAWSSGTLLIQHDPTSELAQLDVRAGMHYVDYNGTVADLIGKVRYYQAHLDEAESILRAGLAKGAAIPDRFNMHRATEKVLAKFAKKLGLEA